MTSNAKHKSKVLEAQKLKLLNDIQDIEREIKDIQSRSQTNYFHVDDSSDSDDDFFIIPKVGCSFPKLKYLRKCLVATEELTNMEVRKFELNIMVEDPIFEGEPPITENGIWREVMAEYCIGTIMFSMTFYVHEPYRKFGPKSFRGLRITFPKVAHEKELVNSVLHSCDTPSDAVWVIASYADEWISRRTTLDCLVDKYGGLLFMEAAPEGGYHLKFANVMELYWTLENTWSRVKKFNHSLKLSIEHLDKKYVKQIAEFYQQLRNPHLETNERTVLLHKIMSVCLQGRDQDPQSLKKNDSGEDLPKHNEATNKILDNDTKMTKNYKSNEIVELQKNIKLRHNTLDDESEMPTLKKKKDNEIMAPPMTLPKKIKSKNKENENDNKMLTTSKASNVNKEISKNDEININVSQKVTNHSNKKLVSSHSTGHVGDESNRLVPNKKISDPVSSNNVSKKFKTVYQLTNSKNQTAKKTNVSVRKSTDNANKINKNVVENAITNAKTKQKSNSTITRDTIAKNAIEKSTLMKKTNQTNIDKLKKTTKNMKNKIKNHNIRLSENKEKITKKSKSKLHNNDVKNTNITSKSHVLKNVADPEKPNKIANKENEQNKQIHVDTTNEKYGDKLDKIKKVETTDTTQKSKKQNKIISSLKTVNVNRFKNKTENKFFSKNVKNNIKKKENAITKTQAFTKTPTFLHVFDLDNSSKLSSIRLSEQNKHSNPSLSKIPIKQSK